MSIDTTIRQLTSVGWAERGRGTAFYCGATTRTAMIVHLTRKGGWQAEIEFDQDTNELTRVDLRGKRGVVKRFDQARTAIPTMRLLAQLPPIVVGGTTA